MQARSVCIMACEVQESGLCTPDWVGVHCKDADLYERLRNVREDSPKTPMQSWRDLCNQIENQRHFLFDELPNVRKVSNGLWTDPTAALNDYARRIHQPELPAQASRLWN